MINPNLKAGDEVTLPPDTDLQAVIDYWDMFGDSDLCLQIEDYQGFYQVYVEEKKPWLAALMIGLSSLAVIGTGAYIVWRLGGVG